MNAFTAAFAAALLLSLGTRLWLARRHLRHLQAHRNQVPEAFAGSVGLEAHRKAADYTSAKTRLAVAHFLLDAALLLALTLGGGLQWLWDLWGRALDGSLARGIAFIASITVLLSAAEIPLSAWRVFVIEERFGFNKMTPATFAVDLAKQAAVGAALGLPVLALTLWLMERSGELWWLYAWAAWVAFNLVLLAVYPTWIAPLFNKFSPLEDAALKERIERLLTRCGFASRGLFVMDGSKRSSHGNAYFTGFGRSKRIVFFDTLLSRLEIPEVEAVLAHELGHFRRHHVLKRLVLSAVFSLALLFLLGVIKNQPWFYGGLNVAFPATDAMALTLFFLVMPVFTFLLQPLLSMYSRRHEFEADQYAAQNASARDLVSALVKLYKDNASTLTPDPVHSAFYDSHPPAPIRITRLQQASPA